MNRLFLIPALLISILLFGCKKKNDTSAGTTKNVYKIAVVSDIHYMDPSLLIKDGAAFKKYLVTDGKLLYTSDAIMKELISELLKASPDLVLFAGDMTKDGENICHATVANKYLKQLIDKGIKVRVVNGNHDIMNPHPYSYDGDNSTLVDSTTSSQFKSFYANCGFSDAIYTDTGSLSYVSEPLPNLWLLVIDACRYSDNPPYVPFADMTGGTIKQTTMLWALDRIAEANKKGKTIFGMMHPALLEHFTGQSQLFQGFVVDDWKNKSDSMMNAGLHIIFTGHFHANDIVERQNDTSFLYDISTGSTEVFPCPYRMITYVKDSSLIISTNHITHIDYQLPAGQSFPQYAEAFGRGKMDTMLFYSLYAKDSIDINKDWSYAHRMTAAWMANMAGDENIFPSHEIDSINSTLNSYPDPTGGLKTFTNSLWNDLPPRDNSIMIYLKSGSSFKK